jgi:thioredoxin 1
MLGPIMDDISNTNEVYKINVDKDQDLAREYGVMSIPCVIVFKDGKEFNRSVGLKSKEDILSMIK